MLTISVFPRRLKDFLLTHPLYKSPPPHSTFCCTNGRRLGTYGSTTSTLKNRISALFSSVTACLLSFYVY